MGKIPIWKRAVMKARMEKTIKKQYEGSTQELEAIKDKIADLIESTPEKEQLNILIIICSEIISGLEDKPDRDFVLDMVKETLNRLKN